MKRKKRKRIAFLLALAMIFMNLFPITNSDGEIVITPLSEVALAAEATDPAVVETDPSASGSINGDVYTFYMVKDSQIIEKGEGIELNGTTVNIGIDSSTGVIPAGVTIEWQPYDESIIKVNEVIDASGDVNKYKVNVEAVGPGYAMLNAIITFPDGSYSQVFCQFHVPLEFSNSNDVFDDKYGFTQRQATDTENNKTLQLSTLSTNINHYLMLLNYVDYKEIAGTKVTNLKTPDGVAITDKTAPNEVLEDAIVPADGIFPLIWKTSNSNVAEVNEYGVVTAVGAGYAEITVTTRTKSETGKSDSLTFPVIVAPLGYVLDGEVGNPNSTLSHFKEVVANTSTINIVTNAKNASDLVWNIHKDDQTGDLINLQENDYMDVNISTFSNRVTLSDLKAGVYYITARPTSKFDEYNTNVGNLQIKLIVPVKLSLDPREITMNVGNFYDITSAFNVTSRDQIIFEPTDANTGNVVSVVDGVITGLAKGKEVLNFTYSPSLFDGMDLGTNPTKYAITVNIIDRLAINMTNASIYVGSNLQLQLLASDNFTKVVWTSSNEAVAKVDANGLVTGEKAGDTVITATQTVNGVVKKVTCKVKVKQAVTKVTLDPTNKTIAVGDNLTINATVDPEQNGASLRWITSDSEVVEIIDAGDLSATVKGVSGGSVVITAINIDNVVVGTCKITVYEEVAKITLSETAVTVPVTMKWFQLHATISPEAAKNQTLVWSTSDSSIVTVDQLGKVTLNKSGTASIIVTSKKDASIYAMCTVTVTKAVSGITLDSTSRELYVGQTVRLTYKVNPSDASNTAVTFTTTNSNVATVDSTGLVTARNVGSTAIILKTVDGGFMSICLVTVKKSATGVKLDVTDLTLNVGDVYYLETLLTPADATDNALTWESTNGKVASVTNKGKIIAKAGGTTVIFVKTPSGATTYCNVTVMQGAAGIKISKSEATISVSDTLELEAIITPDTASDQGVTWKSSKPSIASIDKNGKVKGLKGGTTIITVTSDDGNYVDHCILTVKELVTDITLNKTYYKLGLGKTFKLVATISGETATNKQVKWTTSNKKIVSVDTNGRIKGLKLGTATITAKATDGSGAEASCVIRVSRLVTSIDLNMTYVTIVQGQSVKIRASVSPSNATYKVPLWSSDTPEVAIVSKKGVVTGLEPGNAIITAKANDSSGVSSICYVNVIAPVASTSISISESEVVMSPGETKTVAISIVPNNSTDDFTWSSDNSMVATVNSSTGMITAKALGTANITVMTESGRKGSIKVYVVGLSRTNVSLEQYTSLLLNLEVDGKGESDLNVRWDVENQEIATVRNGKVTAKAIGTTTVYAVVNGRRLSCRVTVTKIK